MSRLIAILPVLLLSACLSFHAKPPRYEPQILASGVVVKDIVVPKGGPRAKPGDRITVHYELSLNDGTEVDSSWDRGQPYDLVLGEGALAPGIEEGLIGMRLFGKRRVIVPPELGYGDAGLPPRIPGKAILRVTIELMRLEPGT